MNSVLALVAVPPMPAFILLLGFAMFVAAPAAVVVASGGFLRMDFLAEGCVGGLPELNGILFGDSDLCAELVELLKLLMLLSRTGIALKQTSFNRNFRRIKKITILFRPLIINESEV